MSKRPPLLSDDDINRIVDALDFTQHVEVDMERAAMAVRIQYEEARAKDAELIQKLVDGWHEADGGHDMRAAIRAAEAAGFKPSEP